MTGHLYSAGLITGISREKSKEKAEKMSERYMILKRRAKG